MHRASIRPSTGVGSMTAEMNNSRRVPEQKALQIARTYRELRYDAKNFADACIQKRASNVPRFCGEVQARRIARVGSKEEDRGHGFTWAGEGNGSCGVKLENSAPRPHIRALYFD